MRRALLGLLVAIPMVTADAQAETHGIVFTSALKLDGDSNANGGIYFMRADGTKPRKLTNFQTVNFAFRLHGLDLPDDHASCSADGKKIYFCSSRTGEPGIFAPNESQIFSMNPNGSGLVQLTNVAGRNIVPTLSPDGSKIAFASERNGGVLHIFLMNPDGSNVEQLTFGQDPDSEPAWSPDSSRIAFTRIPFSPLGLGFTQKDVWIVDRNGANLRRLTDTLGEDHDPVFSPDGTRIAYSSERAIVPNPPFGDTWVINIAQGANDPGINLTSDLAFGAGDPAWHPDGSKIAFFKSVLPVLSSPMQIWTMDADGGNKVHVTHLLSDGILNIHPSWCKLADSDVDGRPDYEENQNLSFHQSALRISVAGTNLGAGVGYADLTHDGFADLAGALPLDSVSSLAGAGRVMLLRGSAFGPDLNDRDQLPVSVTAATFGAAPVANGELGRAMVGCDFDGDGFSDLAIGAPGQDKVFVMRGKAGPYQTLSGSGRFGAALAAGDFNGDGRCDLAVGAPLESRGGGAALRGVEAGAVRVFFGSPGGLGTTPQIIDQSVLPAGEHGGNEAGDAFGAALAAGKLGGDNAVDLAIGSPGETIAGVSEAGVVHVVRGVVNGPLEVATAVTRDARSLPAPHDGLQAGARFGEVLAIGKFAPSTGPSDLVVGVPRQDVSGSIDAGLVATYSTSSLVTAPSLSTTAKVLTAAQVGGMLEPNAAFGQALAAGDASGDLTADLAIAAPGQTIAGKAASGAVYLVLGGPASQAGCSFCGPGTASFGGGLNAATATRLLQGAVGDVDEAGDRFGGSDVPGSTTLAFADIDKDGQADLLIGTPKESALVAGSGLLSVRYGLRVGISTLSPARATTPAGEPITYTLEWKHPSRWRVLDTLHLRIKNDVGTAIWVRFRENGEELLLGLQADDGTFVEGRPGEARVLSGTGGRLDLSKSKVTGSGPDGPTVALELALVPDIRTSGQAFDVELLATDDLGHVQGFEKAGSLTVERTFLASGSGCAVGASPRGALANLGVVLAAVVALALRRRSTRRAWGRTRPARRLPHLSRGCTCSRRGSRRSRPRCDCRSACRTRRS